MITEIILNPELLTLGGHAISALHLQHGAFSDERAWPEEKRWIGAAKLQELTVKWAQMVVEEVRSGHIFSATQSGMIFFRLKRFQPDALFSVIDDLLASDANFDRYAMAIGQHGSDSIGGKYAKFSDDDLDGFGGVEVIKRRATERLQDSTVIGELKNILSAMLSNKKTYLTSGTETHDD
jgi:hypothetical protein